MAGYEAKALPVASGTIPRYLPKTEEQATIQTTEKLSITLPKDMADMVRDKVQGGAYASNSEVIREALRLMQGQEQLRELELEGLRPEIAEGRASGEPVPAEQVFDRLKARYARLACVK